LKLDQRFQSFISDEIIDDFPVSGFDGTWGSLETADFKAFRPLIRPSKSLMKSQIRCWSSGRLGCLPRADPSAGPIAPLSHGESRRNFRGSSLGWTSTTTSMARERQRLRVATNPINLRTQGSLVVSFMLLRKSTKVAGLSGCSSREATSDALHGIVDSRSTTVPNGNVKLPLTTMPS
jgi:hypothetical protein